MKKNKYYLYFIIIIPFILWFFEFNNHKKEFNEIYKDVYNKTSVINNYLLSFDVYFSRYFSYPKNISVLLNEFKNEENIEEIKDLLKDPFNTKTNLIYAPIYSKKNKIAEGFILFSRGIDKNQDNILNDSIFFEDVKKLKFYNYNSNDSFIRIQPIMLRYNYINYLIGNKDYLFANCNGVEEFILNSKHNKFSLTKLKKRIQKLKPNNIKFSTMEIYGKVIEKGSDFITIYDSSVKGYCKMYKGRSFSDIKIGQVVKCACQYRGNANLDKNEIYFENCIILK